MTEPDLPVLAAEPSAARLRGNMVLALDHIRDYAICLISPDEQIVSWNLGAELLLGYRADEVVGRSASMLFTPEDRTAGVPQREIEVALRVGRAEDDRWHVRKDGSRFYGSGILAPIHEPPDGLIGFIKVLRDQTERMRAEVERERLLTLATESNRIRDEFLSTISHELRTPLNSVFGWTQLLRQGSVASHMVPQVLEIIERNARLQAQLIEDLLDVSRIMAGKIRLRIEPVSLAAPLSAAIETVRPAADQKGVELRVQLAENACDVLADLVRLQQIFWNTLSNAIKFTPGGGRVTVSSTRVGDRVEIAVADTGAGIGPEFLPFVFDRFRQADSSSTRSQTGLGLGLAIVKYLVELHGGSVAVESAGRGKGATFRVLLPCAPVPAHGSAADVAVLPPSALPPRVLEGVRILVLDDEPDARQLLAVALGGAGASVDLAGSSAAALEAAAITAPHIVLVDLAMPEVDGFGFLKRFRAITGATRLVPVVAVTAYARQEDRDRCFAAGFDAHITKPVDLRQLVTLVAGLLVSDDGNGT